MECLLKLGQHIHTSNNRDLKYYSIILKMYVMIILHSAPKIKRKFKRIVLKLRLKLDKL